MLTQKGPETERSRRSHAMPASLSAALRTLRDRHAFERANAGSEWRDSGLVFVISFGGPLEPSIVLNSFKRRVAAAGLPEQRFHDLRHASASLFPAQEVPARVVMNILGHSQIARTIDLYSHVMSAAHQDLANLMNGLLSPLGKVAQWNGTAEAVPSSKVIRECRPPGSRPQGTTPVGGSTRKARCGKSGCNCAPARGRGRLGAWDTLWSQGRRGAGEPIGTIPSPWKGSGGYLVRFQYMNTSPKDSSWYWTSRIVDVSCTSSPTLPQTYEPLESSPESRGCSK